MKHGTFNKVQYFGHFYTCTMFIIRSAPKVYFNVLSVIIWWTYRQTWKVSPIILYKINVTFLLDLVTIIILAIA